MSKPYTCTHFLSPDASSSIKYHGRYSKKRENGNGRGPQPDFSSRKPLPQKSRTTVDKRPRQRGSFGDRQREEVCALLQVLTPVHPSFHSSPILTKRQTAGFNDQQRLEKQEIYVVARVLP